jgi:PIN domain nuclease of toxin-antitoxin system
MRVVLDTHILVLWVSSPESLSPSQLRATRDVNEQNPAIVADVSLWEIAMLHATDRLAFSLPLQDWLTRAVAPPLVRVAEITPRIVTEVTNLSHWDNRDPADRLIVATTRVYGAALLTDDQRIRDSGLVEVV